MLRTLRIVLAALFFIGTTLLLAGIGAGWLGWMAKVQFMPSLMRVIGSATLLNIAILGGILLLTLVLGRIYCSVICPLGVWQDIVNWFSARRKKHRRRFSFKPENKWLRYIFWAFYVAVLVFGVQVVVSLLAPYSAWGRIVSTALNPLGAGTALIIVAVVTLLFTGVLAWVGGRTYCNTFCPVGTTLSFFSRFAIFRPRIDAEACTGCRMCEKGCRSSCIDIKNKTIDYSRCVDCFDCVDSCKFGAMSFGTGKDKPQADSKGRRAFLAGSALALTSLTLKAQEQKLDGGLAPIVPKRTPERTERIVPPGAGSAKDFHARCTACQLCVDSCPNGVLRPSTDLDHFMQPEASFEKGYCRPECSACSQVCPAGAILPVTPEERTQIHVGVASVNTELCVAVTDGVQCGNCARHCPAAAITMVRLNPEDDLSPLVPAVFEEKCIGCGACEYLCPSRPFSAIHVNGLKIHING